MFIYLEKSVVHKSKHIICEYTYVYRVGWMDVKMDGLNFKGHIGEEKNLQDLHVYSSNCDSNI
mgnify:CR=1 FL=1